MAPARASPARSPRQACADAADHAPAQRHRRVAALGGEGGRGADAARDQRLRQALGVAARAEVAEALAYRRHPVPDHRPRVVHEARARAGGTRAGCRTRSPRSRAGASGRRCARCGSGTRRRSRTPRGGTTRCRPAGCAPRPTSRPTNVQPTTQSNSSGNHAGRSVVPARQGEAADAEDGRVVVAVGEGPHPVGAGDGVVVEERDDLPAWTPRRRCSSPPDSPRTCAFATTTAPGSASSRRSRRAGLWSTTTITSCGATLWRSATDDTAASTSSQRSSV